MLRIPFRLFNRFHILARFADDVGHLSAHFLETLFKSFQIRLFQSHGIVLYINKNSSFSATPSFGVIWVIASISSSTSLNRRYTQAKRIYAIGSKACKCFITASPSSEVLISRTPPSIKSEVIR